MPGELRNARLVLNEQHVEVRDANPLQARLDQVFVTRAGQVVLVESKTRNNPRPRRADQVQLSAQRVILERLALPVLRGAVFAAHGYVRVVGESGMPRYRRVELLPTSAVEALQARDMALRQGGAPWMADDPRRCERCHTRDRCPAWAARQHTPLAAWWSRGQWQLLRAMETAQPGYAPLLSSSVPTRPPRGHTALADRRRNTRAIQNIQSRASSGSRSVSDNTSRILPTDPL